MVMGANSLVVLPHEIPKSRAEILYGEFKYAWDKTSSRDKKKWAVGSLKLFGKVTYRRGKGFAKAMYFLGKSVVKESTNLGSAIYHKETMAYINDRKEKCL